MLMKMALALSFIHLILKYEWVIRNAIFNTTKKLGQTEVNKY